jgi:hypothetical protein
VGLGEGLQGGAGFSLEAGGFSLDALEGFGDIGVFRLTERV